MFSCQIISNVVVTMVSEFCNISKRARVVYRNVCSNCFFSPRMCDSQLKHDNNTDSLSFFPDVLFVQQDLIQHPFSNCRASARAGEATSIYGLYRYVPRDRVGFLRFLILK